MLEKVEFGKWVNKTKILEQDNILHLIESKSIIWLPVVELVQFEGRRISFDCRRDEEKFPDKILFIKFEIDQDSMVFSRYFVRKVVEVKSIPMDVLVVSRHVYQINSLILA